MSFDRCNARKKGRTEGLPKVPAGPYAGQPYCGSAAGSGTMHGGTGRCKKHGGNSLVGAASGRYIDGRRIRRRVVPTRLAEAYELAMNDSELLSLQHEIALATARLEEMIVRLGGGESGAAWRATQKNIGMFNVAFAADDKKAMEVAMKALDEAITEGLGEDSGWREYERTVEHLRKLIETERKLMEARQMTIDAPRLAEMVMWLNELIRRSLNREVKDVVERKRVLSGIAKGIRQLIDRTPEMRTTIEIDRVE